MDMPAKSQITTPLEETPDRAPARSTSASIAEIDSPIGEITVILRDERVLALLFSDRLTHRGRSLESRIGSAPGSWCRAPRSSPALRAIERYFAGDLEALESIATDPLGTPFQRAVWDAVRRVRAGATASYADIARAVGSPQAVRAVGAANGANPICLIVPCHRIVGSDGSLTGYGGGIERKRWLLAHESTPTHP